MKKIIPLIVQRKKLWISFTFTIIALLSINYACRKISPDIIDEFAKKEYSTDKHVIDYNASLSSDSTLHFSIKIHEEVNDTKQIEETFDINMKKNIFSENIYNILTERAADPEYDKLTYKELQVICNSIKNMITETISPLSDEVIRSPKIQGLYLSLSFARQLLSKKLGLSQAFNKTVKSNKQTSKEQTTIMTLQDEQPLFEQDVYEGAALGISSFAFNDDIIVDKDALTLVIAEDLAIMGTDTKGLYVFQEALNNISQSIFTLRDLLREMDVYRAAHPELIENMTGWWPQGSDHGCCGNYSGPCLFWHPICYIHDKICRKCKPKLFCLPGCVPDGGFDTSGPFYFIEDMPVPGEHEILLPSPLPSTIYYNTIGIRMTAHSSTPVFFNLIDRKYYSDSGFQNLVPDAYYKLPNETIDGKYYRVINGQISTTIILPLH